MLTVAPVEIDDLITAYALAEAAAEDRDSGASVVGEGFFLANENGAAEWHELSDDPLNRAILAIRRRFPKGMMHVLMLRLTALGEMAEFRDADFYISTGPDAAGCFEMSRAMFAAAAEMPLIVGESLNARRFSSESNRPTPTTLIDSASAQRAIRAQLEKLRAHAGDRHHDNLRPDPMSLRLG